MSQSNEFAATRINTDGAESAILATPAKSETGVTVAAIARKATKDAGRVHVGGGMMHF